MNLSIREFHQDDYPAVVSIDNILYPEHTRTIDEARWEDEHRNPRCMCRRWVAERDGKIVAHCQYYQFEGFYHPRKFWVHAAVLPELQRQGIGSALFDHVLRALEPLDPIAIKARTTEDRKQTCEFLVRRGFAEQDRGWESWLDVAKFDFAPYEGIEENVRCHGIEIKTFKDLESDPERNRKIFELDEELTKDVPASEPRTPLNFEHYVGQNFKCPALLPDAYFIALHEGRYIGMSNLWSSEADRVLWTGFTAVKREYRRMGVALALKLRGIEYAKTHGHPTIKTWNHQVNSAILSINERLGFVKRPAWINYIKVLKEEK